MRRSALTLLKGGTPAPAWRAWRRCRHGRRDQAAKRLCLRLRCSSGAVSGRRREDGSEERDVWQGRTVVKTQIKAGAKARIRAGTRARAERKFVIRARIMGGAGTMAATIMAVGAR